MGFYRLNLAQGYQTVGVSVVNPSLFGSWINSSAASAITASDPTVDVGGLLDGTKAYYLEIVEGPSGSADLYVGQRFEMDVAVTQSAGTPDGVIILDLDSERTSWQSEAASPASVPELDGYRFELRAHVTLGQVFDPSALYGSTNFADADQVQVFNGSGFTLYYVLGNNDTFAQWTKQTGGDFSTKDDLPIAPGQGLIYRRSGSSPGPVSLRVKGLARTTPFVQPMRSGFNFVAEAFPASNSFDGKGAYGGVFANLDRVQVFNGTGFTTFQLYTDGGDSNLWVNVLDGGFTNQNLNKIFDYRGAVFVDLETASDSYRIAPPYSP